MAVVGIVSFFLFKFHFIFDLSISVWMFFENVSLSLSSLLFRFPCICVVSRHGYSSCSCLLYLFVGRSSSSSGPICARACESELRVKSVRMPLAFRCRWILNTISRPLSLSLYLTHLLPRQTENNKRINIINRYCIRLSRKWIIEFY